MIEQLLPSGAASAEARGANADHLALFPGELALAATATSKRREEFAGGRACAHEALRGLGMPAAPVGRGARGEPLWPVGVVGSITHCDGYRGCAVARASEWLALAIDAEPHAPISAQLLERIAGPRERRRHADLTASHPSVHWGKLLFSAKESVYKALSPTAIGRPALTSAELKIDGDRGTFVAQLPANDRGLRGKAVERLEGRWQVRGGLILTVIAVPRMSGAAVKPAEQGNRPRPTRSPSLPRHCPAARPSSCRLPPRRP